MTEEKEVGDRSLLPYQTPKQKDSSIPIKLLNAHEIMAMEMEGIINDMILRDENVKIGNSWLVES